MAENEKKPPNPFAAPHSDPDQRPPSDSGAEDSDDSILDFNAVASVREGASGTIPLTQLPDPQSSPSLISWTEVIRQHRETQVVPELTDESVQIDSVSDKDLLKRIVAEEQDRLESPLPAEIDTDKLGVVQIVDADDSHKADSAVQLSNELASEAVQQHSGSVVRFDVKNPPSDAGGAMPMPWDDEVLEALPVDEDESEFADEIPMAEPVYVDGDELLTLDQSPSDGGSVARMISEQQDLDDITEIELTEGSGLVAEHSSILDLLIKESEGEREESGVVNITGKPGPSLLSGLSDNSTPKGLSSQNKFVVPDVESPTVAPGNSWLREELISATPTDAQLTNDEIVQATEAVGGLRDESPAPGHVSGWDKERDSQSGVTVDESFDEEMSPLAEASDNDSAIGALPPTRAGSGWLERDEETSLETTGWTTGNSGSSKRTMESFQLPAENPDEAVDLYSEGPFNRGISDSGRLNISDEEIEEATRKQQAIESSSIDLSSKTGSSSLFNIEVEVEKPAPIEETVDLSLPEGAENDSSLIRSFDDIVAEETLARQKESGQQAPEVEADEIAFEDEAIEAEAPPVTMRSRGGRRLAEPADSAFSEAEPESVEVGEEDAVYEEPSSATAMPAPAKVERPRKKRGGMLVGTMLGVVLGGGGLFAAYYFGQLPADPETLFGDAGTAGKNTKPPVGKNVEPVAKTTADAPTPARARQLLEAGNIAQALAIYSKCDQTSPEVLAGQGQAKWLAYLQKCALDKKTPDRQAPEVVAALVDLKSAVAKAKGNAKAETDAARAYLWEGLVEEAFDDFATAEKIYTEAETELKGETALAMIKAANARLQVIRPGQGAQGKALPPEQLFLTFALLLAEEPETASTPGDSASQEAGFLFWDAALLAARHDYAKAVAKIPAIKAVHARQQITAAGRGLNPLSDPREQILTVCLDELARYWALCDQLYKDPNAKALVDQRKPVEAFEAIVARSKDSDEAVKLIADKLMLKPNEKVAEAIQSLLTAKAKAEDARKAAEEDKKTADDMLAGITKSLKDAGIDDAKVEDGLKKLVTTKADADAKLKAVSELLDKAGIKEPEASKGLATLIAARDDAESIVKSLRERFEKAKYIEADANRDAVLKAVDDAITRGSADAVVKLTQEKKEAEAKAAKLEAETDKAKKDAEALVKKTMLEAAEQKAMTDAKFADVRTPTQIIDIWIPALLDADKLANAGAALQDAELVLKNVASDDTAKAKAIAVKALALRNQGKITEARSAFEEAKKHPGFAKDQAWSKDIAKAAEILDDPAAFVAGTPAPAPATSQKLLEQVENGLKLFSAEAFPKDYARLLARRGLLKLESNDVEGAAADAEAAIKADAGPEGQFTLGRVREQQGRSAEAEQAYRAVVKGLPENAPLARQARLGLARVLLQKAVKPAAPPPAKEEAAAPPVALDQPTRITVLLLTTMFWAPEEDGDQSIREAIKLADILIAEKEYLGHIIKADALAKMKRYNAALQEYSIGIKALKVLPKEYDSVLDRILALHPALQQPDANVNLDSSLALRHYGMGLELFREGLYDKAEQEFIQSIRFDNRDARYMYYLGLSRWLQNKNEVATEDFKAGAALELQGRPTARAINSSLESIQGPPRMAVEKFRP